MNLFNQLQSCANANRLNAVDSAYIGRPTRGSNFKGKWLGYNNDGYGVIKFADKTYAADSLGSYSAIRNQEVMLRVSKGQRFIVY
mgnify:CR=1 FL=1